MRLKKENDHAGQKDSSACHSGSLSRKLDLLVALQRFGVVEELQAEKKTLAVSVSKRALLPWQCHFARA
jgi:hypothetical protein